MLTASEARKKIEESILKDEDTWYDRAAERIEYACLDRRREIHIWVPAMLYKNFKKRFKQAGYKVSRGFGPADIDKEYWVKIKW